MHSEAGRASVLTSVAGRRWRGPPGSARPPTPCRNRNSREEETFAVNTPRGSGPRPPGPGLVPAAPRSGATRTQVAVSPWMDRQSPRAGGHARDRAAHRRRLRGRTGQGARATRRRPRGAPPEERGGGTRGQWEARGVPGAESESLPGRPGGPRHEPPPLGPVCAGRCARSSACRCPHVWPLRVTADPRGGWRPVHTCRHRRAGLLPCVRSSAPLPWSLPGAQRSDDPPLPQPLAGGSIEPVKQKTMNSALHAHARLGFPGWRPGAG